MLNIAQPQSQTAAQPRIGALIRARRRQLHMTLQALGDAAGLSVGFLSQVERDQATPSLGALAGIARGLGVDIDHFIATPSIGGGVTREGDRARFSLTGSSITYEQLHAEFAGRSLSSFILTIQPGHKSETVRHEGDELLYVLDGELTYTVEGETIRLKPGDSLHFRGASAHRWANETKQPARVLWTGTMPILRPRADTQGNTPAAAAGAMPNIVDLGHSVPAGRTKR